MPLDIGLLSAVRGRVLELGEDPDQALPAPRASAMRGPEGGAGCLLGMRAFDCFIDPMPRGSGS